MHAACLLCSEMLDLSRCSLFACRFEESKWAIDRDWAERLALELEMEVFLQWRENKWEMPCGSRIRTEPSLGLASFARKDGNRAGSGRVECLGTQNRNPNLKSEPASNTDSGENTSPKPKSVDTGNPIGNPKPALCGNIVSATSTFYKHIHDIYNIYMYKQEAINSN